MYARIVQVPIRPEAIAEATQYFHESVGPRFSELQGFKNCRFLIDSSTNTCMISSLYESEADRAKAETDGFLAHVLTTMKSYFAGQPTVHQYKLVEEIS